MKKIFSVIIILCIVMSALSVTSFAANDVLIGDVDYVNKNDITVNFSVTGLTAEDYVTILIYKEDDVAGYTDDDIVYINQVTADNNKIELAIPANSAGGKYVVLMGGTDVNTAKSTYFTITSLIYGDVNKDGQIDSEDAVYVLQKAINMTITDDIKIELGDVNEDGEYTSEDAVYILQKALNMTITDEGVYVGKEYTGE